VISLIWIGLSKRQFRRITRALVRTPIR
jgi:hypothetical protein